MSVSRLPYHYELLQGGHLLYGQGGFHHVGFQCGSLGYDFKVWNLIWLFHFIKIHVMAK